MHDGRLMTWVAEQKAASWLVKRIYEYMRVTNTFFEKSELFDGRLQKFNFNFADHCSGLKQYIHGMIKSYTFLVTLSL